jgi:hypothetical protein
VDDPWCRLWTAHHYTVVRNWSQSRAILEAGGTVGLSNGMLRHYYHLYGLVLMHLSEHDAAAVALRRGEEAGPGPCVLHDLRILAEPLPDPLPESHFGPEQPLMQQIYGAIHTADRCLEAGDPRGALLALDRNAVYTTGEIQSTIRLASAWLQVEPVNEAEGLRRRMCLLRLLFSLQSVESHRYQIPLRCKIWSGEEIMALSERIPKAILGGLSERLVKSMEPARKDMKTLKDKSARSLAEMVTKVLDCVQPQQIAEMVTSGAMTPENGNMMLTAKLALEQARMEGRPNPLLPQDSDDIEEQPTLVTADAAELVLAGPHEQHALPG